MALGPTGSSWSKVIGPLEAEGINVVAAPLPLISLADGVAAVDHVLERVKGPVVLAGHAYGGTVIGETRSPKVTSLVYIAALAPDEGETIATSSTAVRRTAPCLTDPSGTRRARSTGSSKPPRCCAVTGDSLHVLPDRRCTAFVGY